MHYPLKNVARFEIVQRLATRMFQGQRDKSYTRRLKNLNSCLLGEDGFKDDMTETFKNLRTDTEDMFREVTEDSDGVNLW